MIIVIEATRVLFRSRPPSLLSSPAPKAGAAERVQRAERAPRECLLSASLPSLGAERFGRGRLPKSLLRSRAPLLFLAQGSNLTSPQAGAKAGLPSPRQKRRNML